MFSVDEIIAIIMTVIFVASFLSIFFFTYVSKIEEQVVKNQVSFIVNDLLKPLKMISKESLNYASLLANNIPTPNLSAEDDEVEKHNHEVYMNTMKLIAISFIVGMIILFYISKKYKLNFWQIVKKNTIIILFVALTEYLFLNCFAKNYMSADPNIVKRTIITKLLQI